MTDPRLALVVEPEDSMGDLAGCLLHLAGWSVYHVTDAHSALRLLRGRAFDLVCCEYDVAAGLHDVAVRALHEAAGMSSFVVTSPGTRGAAVARALRVPFLRQPATSRDIEVVVRAVPAAA